MTADAWSELWRALGTLGLAVATGYFALRGAANQTAGAERREKLRLDREDARARAELTRASKAERIAQLQTLCVEFAQIATAMGTAAERGLTDPEAASLNGAVAKFAIQTPESLALAATMWGRVLVAFSATERDNRGYGSDVVVALGNTHRNFLIEARRVLAVLERELEEMTEASQ